MVFNMRVTGKRVTGLFWRGNVGYLVGFEEAGNCSREPEKLTPYRKRFGVRVSPLQLLHCVINEVFSPTLNLLLFHNRKPHVVEKWQGGNARFGKQAI